jgi:hypothetical protein
MIPDVIGGLREIVLGEKQNHTNVSTAQISEKTREHGASFHPEQVMVWLTELDRLASSGDIQGLQSRIHTLKQGITSQSES